MVRFPNVGGLVLLAIPSSITSHYPIITTYVDLDMQTFRTIVR